MFPAAGKGPQDPSNLQLDWPVVTGEYKLQQKGLLPKEDQHMWVWSKCVEITCQSPISVGTISFWVSPILKHMKHAEVIRMQLDATIFLGAVWKCNVHVPDDSNARNYMHLCSSVLKLELPQPTWLYYCMTKSPKSLKCPFLDGLCKG